MVKKGLIQWVIVGGESGNKKTIRPMLSVWARFILCKCRDYKVPFFFKQFGEWIEYDQMPKEFQIKLKNGEAKWKIANMKTPGISTVYTVHRIGKINTGALLDDKEYKEFPIVLP